MIPTPAAVAARPRAVLHAEPAAADAEAEEAGRRHAYPLPDEMPDADGSAFLLRYIPATLLWSLAMSAWLREDDGQPIRVTRHDVHAERNRRRTDRPSRRARLTRRDRLRAELDAATRTEEAA